MSRLLLIYSAAFLVNPPRQDLAPEWFYSYEVRMGVALRCAQSPGLCRALMGAPPEAAREDDINN